MKLLTILLQTDDGFYPMKSKKRPANLPRKLMEKRKRELPRRDVRVRTVNRAVTRGDGELEMPSHSWARALSHVVLFLDVLDLPSAVVLAVFRILLSLLP